jgi:hypothetical protein
MKDLFVYKNNSGKVPGEILLRPLKEYGIEPTVVDLGASNGMFLMPKSYASRAHYIGFEPNEEEHDKLVRHETDC